MEEKENMGVLLREAFQAIVENLHDKLDALGYGEITPSHGWVFQYIKDEGSRVTELARKAKMTKQSMSYLVYELEKKGYLERQPDLDDRRAILFKLTDKGMTLRKIGRSINYEFEQQWIKKIGKKDYESLREILEKLNQALSANR